jgi:hypothetical protein
MSAATYDIAFRGAMLERGFWLYVWEISTEIETHVYYVGRTGDSASKSAQSPFNRMSQHLCFNRNSNALRRQLHSRGLDPSKCAFRPVAHGPLLAEADTLDQRRQRRDRVAAMEKALAKAMTEVGYDVINTIHCRTQLDVETFAGVRTAFASHFHRLLSGESAAATREFANRTKKHGGHA